MSIKWRTRALAVPLVAVAVIAAGACGSGGGSGGTGNSAAPAKADQNMMNPQSRDKIQDGGKLTWAISQFPSNFNYNEVDGTEFDTNDVITGLLPVIYNNDATGKPIWNPDYLASEPKLENGAKQVVTYKINPKAQWSDGKPITWEDFQAQWKATNGSNPAFNISSSNGYDQIESVEKGADDREVKVTYKNKYADWQAVFTPLYPASTNSDPKVFNTGWVDKPLVTAGPFKVGSIDAGTKTITTVRDDKWWGDKAKLDQVVFRTIDPNAQTDSYVNGEIDFIDVASDISKYQRVKDVSGGEVRKAGGPNFRHITFNGTSPMLSDVNVRKGIAMAINRDAIAKALLGQLPVEPKALNNHIFMANQAGYKDNSGDAGKFDLAKAKAALDGAGWKVDGDVRKKDGKALALKFIIPTGVASSKQEAELIQNMLQQVNVKVDLVTVPVSDLFSKYITPGQFDLTVFSWIGTAYPISSIKSVYANPRPGEKGAMDYQQNKARIGSPQLDDAMDKAAQELDHAKAVDLANQADAMIWDEVHSLTTYQRPEIVACKKGLANMGARGFATLRFQDMGWVKS